MTNFEKWVASLTPELVAERFANTRCASCPADEYPACSLHNNCYDSILAYFAEEVAE